MMSGWLMLFCLVSGMPQASGQDAGRLQGAWRSGTPDGEEMLLFQDGYFTHTRYDGAGKRFLMTRGGTYATVDNGIAVTYEFHSAEPEETGKRYDYAISFRNGELIMHLGAKEQSWKRVDDSAAPLAGVWKISERLSDGRLMQIHQRGTRKTLKVLTGTRFQWFAIDPGAKLFAGTGGGTYTFRDGRYTENIEFFSRDNSRVGASLGFDGKLEAGKWHHSGTSSKGDKIYEVWSRAYPAGE